MTSLAHRGFVHLGMDVSKDSISVAILHPDRDVAAVEKISSDSRVGPPVGQEARTSIGDLGLLRGRADRIRLIPAAHLDEGALRRGSPLAGAQRQGGSGQDRQA